MILSVSRRTDIPAFYAEWFMERLRHNEVLVRNPFNIHSISRIPLSPEHVDAIVFWTKNSKPIHKYLDEIDNLKYKYYFQYTITPYKKDLEEKVQGCNIITIGRELGSGGREIGQKLAKKLGWKFIDKEFIKDAVVKSGLSGDFAEHNDQQMTSGEKLLRYISMDNIFNDENLSDNDRLFIAQSKIIKDAAEKGNCVIVGRCADVVLDDCDNCFNIFIAADKDFAKKRVAEEFKLTEDEAVEYIKKVNHLRRNHYNYYTGRTWGEPSRYDMYIKSSSLGIDRAVDAVYNAVKQGK